MTLPLLCNCNYRSVTRTRSNQRTKRIASPSSTSGKADFVMGYPVSCWTPSFGLRISLLGHKTAPAFPGQSQNDPAQDTNFRAG